MTQKMLVIALPLVVALASASAAASRVYPHSGVGCVQAVGSQNSIDRTQYGVHNTSSSSAVTVECPVNPSYVSSAQPVVSIFGVQAYDRNPSADVSCDLQRVDGNGNVSYTTNLHTSNSGAGVQGLVVSPSGVIVSGTWRLRCSVPAAVSGNFSHVTSYSMITSE